MTKRFVSPSAHYQFYQCNIISWTHHQVEFDISVQSVMPATPPPPLQFMSFFFPCFMDSLQSLLSFAVVHIFNLVLDCSVFMVRLPLGLSGCPPFSFDSSSHILIYSIQFQRKIKNKRKTATTEVNEKQEGKQMTI